MPYLNRSSKFLSALLLHGLGFAVALAQNFVKVTEPANPIVSDPSASPNAFSGCSWVDFNGDNRLDLFVNQKALYQNMGGGNFVKLTGALSRQGSATGNAWADMDNDGAGDVFVAGGSPQGSFLYRNDGNGAFTKLRSGAIGDSLGNSGWTAAWADFDNDGLVDLVISAPNGAPGINHTNRLLRNNGAGTFTRIDTSAIAAELGPFTVPSWADYDDDGDMDLAISAGPIAQKGRDYLFQNLLKETGRAFFQRVNTGALANDTRDGQLWNWCDYDNDGDLDVYITNATGNGGATGLANDLYRNDVGTFLKMTAAQVGPIVSDADLSLGSVWQDFDNDGDLDCFVNNDINNTTQRTNRYYRNEGNGTFTRLDNLAPTTVRANHFSAAAGDYDGDGDLDLFIAGTGLGKGLYRNDLANGNHWSNILCVGNASNRAAIGAKVRLLAKLHGTAVWQRRDISTQNGFNGHSALNAHFGLASATVIDTLKISWPSGRIDVHTGVAADRFLIAREGEALLTTVGQRDTEPPEEFVLEQNYPNPFNPTTTIRYSLPRADFVTLTVYDLLGKEQTTLIQAYQSAGRHETRFAITAQMASGLYLYRLRAGDHVTTMKMLVVQ